MRIVHLGDIGTVFEATVYDQDGCLIPNLSTATKLEFLFKPPTSASFRRTATYLATSKIQYATASGDLSEVGKWSGQGYVELVNGYKGHTDKFYFTVDRNL